MPLISALRRPLAALILCAFAGSASGCHSWRTQSGSAESVLAARPYDQVRIATTTDPEMTEVLNPRVVNDTLFEVIAGSTDTTAYPMGQVTAVQVQKGSAAKTVGLVVGLTAGALIITGVAWYAGCGGDRGGNTIGSLC